MPLLQIFLLFLESFPKKPVFFLGGTKLIFRQAARKGFRRSITRSRIRLARGQVEYAQLPIGFHDEAKPQIASDTPLRIYFSQPPPIRLETLQQHFLRESFAANV